MTYVGTIDSVTENDEDFFVIESTYEIELMIERIIPSHYKHPLRVRIQPENTQLIRMITKEYSMEIKTSKWESAQEEILKVEGLTKILSKLEYVKPDQGIFNGELLPFQKLGLDFIQKTGGNTLITDEMGLGKTIETLAYISTKTSEMPVVVVAPLVTLINWKREIEKFLILKNDAKNIQKKLIEPKTRKSVVVLIRHGIEQGQPHDLPPADFYLINYELVDKRFRDIVNMNPKIVIYDEIHSLRNNDTKKYIACTALSRHHTIKHRLGLSGTPIYNRGIEMYNIVEVIKKGILGERSEFVRRYCRSWDKNKTDDDGKIGLAKVLRNTIMIRRKKTEVLKDLPKKNKMKQSISIDVSAYKEGLEKLYDKIQKAREDLKLKNTKEEVKEGLFTLNKTIRNMRLEERQIAGLAKVPFVIDYMNNLLAEYEDEKFVVFCHHRAVHQALFDGLLQYNPVQIIGGQSDKQRQDSIDKFQEGNESRVIICGLRAGSMGINLTKSAYVIFAELDWTPSIHRQAEDRLHRIGQEHTVFAHYLEGIGTFDEVISRILLNKTVEISSVLGEKLETMNNEKALEFLENKLKTKRELKATNLLMNN